MEMNNFDHFTHNNLEAVQSFSRVKRIEGIQCFKS